MTENTRIFLQGSTVHTLCSSMENIPRLNQWLSQEEFHVKSVFLRILWSVFLIKNSIENIPNIIHDYLRESLIIPECL